MGKDGACTKRAASALFGVYCVMRRLSPQRRRQVALRTRDRHTAGRKRVTGDVVEAWVTAGWPAAASGTHRAFARANEWNSPGFVDIPGSMISTRGVTDGKTQATQVYPAIQG
jgi:hypothetical protein